MKHCYNNKQQSRNSDDTHHFSLAINKILWLYPTKLIPWLSRSMETMF